jgi:hypothetical protein
MSGGRDYWICVLSFRSFTEAPHISIEGGEVSSDRTGGSRTVWRGSDARDRISREDDGVLTRWDTCRTRYDGATTGTHRVSNAWYSSSLGRA